MVHPHFSLEVRLFLWLLSRGNFKAVHVDSIVEQNVIPLVFEVQLSCNDPDDSTKQGEHQCNAPIMLAIYNILYFQSQAYFQKPFSADLIFGEKRLLILYVLQNAYRKVVLHV